MKLGLINSAWAQAGRETEWGIQKTKEIGFDSIDIFTDPLDIDVRERRLIKRECDRLDLPIVSICCVAVGLIDFNPSVQRFHVERVQKYLDLVYEYEAKNLLLVLGEYIWNREVIPPEEQWRHGGVKWTIKDGLVYDAQALLREVLWYVQQERRRDVAAGS